MNVKEAKWWVRNLVDLLLNKELVVVYTNEGMYEARPEVRVRQQFQSDYFLEHADGTAVVAICDTYGVHTGFDTLSIDLEHGSPTVTGRTKNAYGDRIWTTFSVWAALSEEDWRRWRALQELSWHAGREEATEDPKAQ